MLSIYGHDGDLYRIDKANSTDLPDVFDMIERFGSFTLGHSFSSADRFGLVVRSALLLGNPLPWLL
jgi:hypothetical protein